MATTVTIGTVTLPAPAGGSTLPRRRARVVGRTASGVVYAYDKSVGWHTATLNFFGLSSTQKSDLITFFDANAGTWTYTDSSGNAYTARFLDPQLQFRQSVTGAYDVTLNLELSAAGV